MKPSIRHGSLAGLLLVFVLAGCSAKHFRKSADKEVYGIIQSKAPLVQNMETNFTIEQTNLVLLEKYPISTNVLEALGPDSQRERGARILRLEDALAIGVKCSRKYQFEKEKLYLSALELTLARHRFAPIFSSQGNVRYEVDKVVDDSNPQVSDHLVEQKAIRSEGNYVKVDWLLGSVGKITTAISADFLRFVSGDRGFVTSSSVGATFSRPLLQNAGFKRERETLTQTERNLLYDLRTFTQFRKDFSVLIATAYYGVLGRRDTVRNSFANLQSSRQNAQRGRALAQEGRLTQSDLGRYEQQELSAESSWIDAVRNYKQDLDDFKVLLGLSVDANLVLDDRELQALRILDPNLPVQDSIRVALAARFDYLNVRDELQDADRKVALAVNFLKPGVDFDADVGFASRQGSSFRAPDPSRYSYSAGLKVDPGLDRVAERNAYRTALIARDRVARDLAQQEDDIKLQVRDSWRTLDQAKRSYEISEIGVKIAERRVEEQDLLAELGRAKAQDQVDAQNALIDSKNQRTKALITHTIARLQFWNRLGILYIKDTGQWEDTQDAKAQPAH